MQILITSCWGLNCIRLALNRVPVIIYCVPLGLHCVPGFHKSRFCTLLRSVVNLLRPVRAFCITLGFDYLPVGLFAPRALSRPPVDIARLCPSYQTDRTLPVRITRLSMPTAAHRASVSWASRGEQRQSYLETSFHRPVCTSRPFTVF